MSSLQRGENSMMQKKEELFSLMIRLISLFEFAVMTSSLITSSIAVCYIHTSPGFDPSNCRTGSPVFEGLFFCPDKRRPADCWDD